MEVKLDPTVEQKFRLQTAILIYATKDSGMTYPGTKSLATLNSVDESGRICPGRCLTSEDLIQLGDSMQEKRGDHSTLTFIPAEILVMQPGFIAWISPSKVAPIFFQTPNDKLNKLNGKPFRHPALVFVINGKSMRVCALDSDARPDGTAKTFQAPYLNVMPNGRVQNCRVQLPRKLTASNLRDWEYSFFASAFTHVGRGDLVKWDGGLLPFCEAMTQEPYLSTGFPTEALVPLRPTLEKFIINVS